MDCNQNSFDKMICYFREENQFLFKPHTYIYISRFLSEKAFIELPENKKIKKINDIGSGL